MVAFANKMRGARYLGLTRAKIVDGAMAVPPITDVALLWLDPGD